MGSDRRRIVEAQYRGWCDLCAEHIEEEDEIVAGEGLADCAWIHAHCAEAEGVEVYD